MLVKNKLLVSNSKEIILMIAIHSQLLLQTKNAYPIPITQNETPCTEKYFYINPLSSPYRAHSPDTILYYLGVWTMTVEFKVNIIKNDIKDYETIINDDLIISNGSTRAWINEINSESENLCKEIKYCFEVIIE